MNSTPGTSTPSEPDDVAHLRARVAELFPALREDLEALVRIPSVSNSAFDQAHVAASAEAVAELLRGAGLPEVQILQATGVAGPLGAPAVVARRPAPEGAPTVLLYAHHDVQPPGDAAAWDTDPFVPTEVDGRLFGRGAADDKAGIVAHVGALRALAALGEDLPIGVTVFVEGEEEVGSPSFLPFLHQYQDLLAADVIVVADSSNWKVGVPGLTTILRGLVDCEVEVAVLGHAVHSGMFGGPVLDALTLLARLITTLHDDQGNVAVDGLVSAPDPSVDYEEADFRADSSVLDGVRLAGEGALSGRLWTKPALSVIGIDAPSVAHASNTLTPRATAKLSLRIAPGQDPAAALAALRTHLEANAPFGAQVTVRDGELGKPFQAPTDSVAMQAARWAFETSWGTAPVDIGIGGSIPFIADLLDVFPGASILVTGVEDPDSRAHGANESVHLGELEKVVLAEALLLTRLAQG
ncbi:dipeptidase [Oerskovia enterophila]|uniref:Succinyl-diaminopimelate desuccinylase n=1 Tax=Oerskovia enterophila TaxID=43678 RepID=A0A163T1X4_9CELL|nr:dipeptidase [Oerskovia enterophila]KZM37001.1 succinyl-diaminopimelate desuccinylase [Oerskovia enterophila]